MGVLPSDLGTQPYLILDIGNGDFAQIDLVWTFDHSAEWDKFRGRPERGLKGFVTGHWFAAMGSPVKVTMTLGKLPFHRKGKSKRDIAKNLFIELVKEVTEDSNADVSDLKGYEGIAVDDFTFKYLVDATVQLGKSLEKNGVIALPTFLNAVKDSFKKRMESDVKSSKFKKVFSGEATPEEKANYKKVVKDANRGLEIVNSIIK
jgi:hypothetical protein